MPCPYGAGFWIPAQAGMTGYAKASIWRGGVGLDCGLRCNDEGLGAMNRAPTAAGFPPRIGMRDMLARE